MRTHGRIKRFLYKNSDFLNTAAISISTLEGWILSMKLTQEKIVKHPIKSWLIESLQDAALWIYLAIILTMIACFFVKKTGNPWVSDKIKFILDQYQIKSIQKGHNEPQDHHRVTLFKKTVCFGHRWRQCLTQTCSKKIPFLGDYLVPEIRSGHISQRSKTKFYISDKSSQTEGVAGKAWCTDEAVIRANLAPIHTPENENDIEDKKNRAQEYAKATKCPEHMLQKYIQENENPPLSIAAIPVRVRGQIWGIIVLDSQNPQGVTQESVDHYQLTVAIIGQLLENL